MLEPRNVTKTVAGLDHISNVSLTLQHGSFNALLGRALSGKSSLIGLMAGLDAPSSGSIWLDGVDVTGVPVQKRNIAMVGPWTKQPAVRIAFAATKTARTLARPGWRSARVAFQSYGGGESHD